MELFLVRHGESESNARGVMEGWGDSDLSARGIEQAARVAARLAGSSPFDALYCSPLRRARHTARIIGSAVACQPHEMEDLREIHIGSWDGKPLRQLERTYANELRRWAEEDRELVFPDGERLADFYDRAERAMQRVLTRPVRRVIIVAHGGMLSACLTRLVEGSASSRYGTELRNCSLSIVRFEEGRAQAVSINDFSHLAEIA